MRSTTMHGCSRTVADAGEQCLVEQGGFYGYPALYEDGSQLLR